MTRPKTLSRASFPTGSNAETPQDQFRRIVLSLNFRGDSFLGPKGLCDAPHLWPARVIVMTLARVGGDAGQTWLVSRRLNAARRMSCFMPRVAFAAPLISCG
jgi:hypothetical protein